MSQIVIVLMLVIVLFLVVLIVFPDLFGRIRGRLGAAAREPHTPRKPQSPHPSHKSAQKYSYVQQEESRGTLLLPQLAIEQLDVHSQRVVHTFFICDVPESGISISRPTAEEGEIKLIDYNELVRSVSERHITIGQDEKGFFWVNRDGNVLTHYNKVKTACHDIKDGDTLYLGSGRQPIRIRILTPEIYSELLASLEDGGSRNEDDRRANTTQYYNGGAPASDLRRRFRQMGGQG